MGDYPANLIEFEDRFRTEAECRAYLENMRWPDGFRCPQCGNQPGWPTGRSGLWECASCHHQTTVTAGTILEGTRKPLRLWFLAMWLIVSEKNGISAKPTGDCRTLDTRTKSRSSTDVKNWHRNCFLMCIALLRFSNGGCLAPIKAPSAESIWIITLTNSPSGSIEELQNIVENCSTA